NNINPGSYDSPIRSLSALPAVCSSARITVESGAESFASIRCAKLFVESTELSVTRFTGSR
ncbi:MAG TPA: hypothetical protein PLD36_10095, partial [Bacteroidia bacterium]|nr:hypothetical protein [Bacteroidia bacterium]